MHAEAEVLFVRTCFTLVKVFPLTSGPYQNDGNLFHGNWCFDSNCIVRFVAIAIDILVVFFSCLDYRNIGFSDVTI